MKKPLPVCAALLIIALTFSAVYPLSTTLAHEPYPTPTNAPTGLTINDADTTGMVTVSWNAVEGATYYRIGWIAEDDFQSVIADGGAWQDAFTFQDLAADFVGTEHTIRNLLPGKRHAFIAASMTRRFGPANWTEWAYHTTAAAPTPTPEPTPPPTPAPPALGTPMPTPERTATPVPTGTDYDRDNDGLIEIKSLAQLDAIRHDLNGNGQATSSRYRAAFPNPQPQMGCPSRCQGYELMQDIDLDSDGNGRFDAPDSLWHDGAGWTPIGYPEGEGDQFTATLNGNGYAIRNLMIDWNDADYVGLFRVLGNGAAILNLNILGAEVTGRQQVGILTGESHGSVTHVTVSGSVNANGMAGGLIGIAKDDATVSHATSEATVTAQYGAAGLIGYTEGTAISHTKALGNVTTTKGSAGGLIETATDTTVTDSCAVGNVRSPNWSGALIASATNVEVLRSCSHGNTTGWAAAFIANATNTTARDTYNIGNMQGTGGTGSDSRVAGIIAYGTGNTVRDSYFSGGIDSPRKSEYFRGQSRPSHSGIMHSEAGTGENSYWDITVAKARPGNADRISSSNSTPKSTRELQAPTENVGIYRKWDPRVWDFGNSVQYPALRGNALTPAEQRNQ